MAAPDFTAKTRVCIPASGGRDGHTLQPVSGGAGLSGRGWAWLGLDCEAVSGLVVSLRFGAHSGGTGRCVSCWATAHVPQLAGVRVAGPFQDLVLPPGCLLCLWGGNEWPGLPWGTWVSGTVAVSGWEGLEPSRRIISRLLGFPSGA